MDYKTQTSVGGEAVPDSPFEPPDGRDPWLSPDGESQGVYAIKSSRVFQTLDEHSSASREGIPTSYDSVTGEVEFVDPNAIEAIQYQSVVRDQEAIQAVEDGTVYYTQIGEDFDVTQQWGNLSDDDSFGTIIEVSHPKDPDGEPYTLLIMPSDLEATGLPFNGNYFTLPKGKPNAGETPMEAAIRETWEETGLVVELM